MKRVSALLLLTLLFSCGELWKTAESAKITCKICKEFVTSFDRTRSHGHSNYAGGDTSWEEENLGSYSDSEVRLVEVLDTVCGKSDYNCHSLLEEAEEDIERWWFKLRKLEENRDLRSWLCFAHLDVCCPENTFGPSCELCPGAPNHTCGSRGKCEGVEEKDGSGACTCDNGYTGDMCQSCDTRFYEEEEEEEEEEGEGEGEGDTKEKELICKACDSSCAGSCDGPGSADCHECADGYKESETGACEDVDECKMDGDTRCKDGTYCYNTPGSFKCNNCDKACKKICNGPGPVKCAECASGYTRNEHGVCKDDDECANGTAKCSEGTYCENSPGKYVCKACHISCLSGCHGAGAKGCVACLEGYVMSVEEGCEDIDECENDPPPCDVVTETCSNLLGSFTCKCQSGLVKGENGRCITREEREAQREAKKEKKRKKKKKKMEAEALAAAKASSGEGEGKEEVPEADKRKEGEREGEGDQDKKVEGLPKTPQEGVNVGATSSGGLSSSGGQEVGGDATPVGQEVVDGGPQQPTGGQEVDSATPARGEKVDSATSTGGQEVNSATPNSEQEVGVSEGNQVDNESLKLRSKVDGLGEGAKVMEEPSSDTRDEL